MSKQPPPLGEPNSHDSWEADITDEDRATTQRLLAAIPGGQALLDWFGGSTNFHDAEIVRLHLDREAGSHIELSLGDARVVFVLADWVDAHILGFSHQNVIWDLALREPPDRAVEAWERGVGLQSGDHEIVLAPTFGAYGTIRATISKIELIVTSDGQG